MATMGEHLKVYFKRFIFKPTLAQLIDTNAVVYPMFPVKAGWACLRVDCRVTVGFNGTTPAITAGDGVDADGFIDAGDVTEATPAIYPGKGAFHTDQVGKLYAADDTVDLTYTGAADTTVGEAHFVGVFYRVF